jgi:hypothetical protein
MYRDGHTIDITGATVAATHARAIRDGLVRRIDVTLGRG